MYCKKILSLSFILLLTNCTSINLTQVKPKTIVLNSFTNKGFALIYNDDLYKKKIINYKIEERSLILFQKNLKVNTQVKVTNIINNKSIIAKVGKDSKYPNFYNSVISMRIAEELDLNIKEPYIEILEIFENSIFVAQKAKTHEEEKRVAVKAPVNEISINDLNNTKTNNKKNVKKDFSYTIKIADFYFKDSALMM